MRRNQTEQNRGYHERSARQLEGAVRTCALGYGYDPGYAALAMVVLPLLMLGPIQRALADGQRLALGADGPTVVQTSGGGGPASGGGGGGPDGVCEAAVCDSGVALLDIPPQNCDSDTFISFAFPVITDGMQVTGIELTVGDLGGLGRGDVYLVGDMGGPDMNQIFFDGCNAVNGEYGELTIGLSEPIIPGELAWIVIVPDGSLAFEILGDASQQLPGQGFVNEIGVPDPFAWADLLDFGFGYCYCVDVIAEPINFTSCPQNSIGNDMFKIAYACGIEAAKEKLAGKVIAACGTVRANAGSPCAGTCPDEGDSCLLQATVDWEKEVKVSPTARRCAGGKRVYMAWIDTIVGCECVCPGSLEGN